MAIVNTEAPLPELKATIILIHPTAPESCPDCGSQMSPCEVADGAPTNTYALRCPNRHRIHVYKEV